MKIPAYPPLLEGTTKRIIGLAAGLVNEHRYEIENILLSGLKGCSVPAGHARRQ